ncbi:MAG: phage portal protein [Eubacterium sp.]|nr:phage portal protein [Eubacterium sp.]
MEENLQKSHRHIGVKVIKAREFDTYTDVAPKQVTKSDRSEQLEEASSYSADEWITHRIDMHGLKFLVDHSTILPQCIRAYKNNIAGFGVEVKYSGDFDETDETKKEWDTLQRILDLLNFDMDTKEIFENAITASETYGIGYLEVIRNTDLEVVGLEFVEDTPSVDMTYPIEPYVDCEVSYKGEMITRQKKFKKYRQTINGRTVYFKEFGDPRVMDKRNGNYIEENGKLELSYQANELFEIKIGDGYYGTPRWLGACITIDGAYRAENLNNNYFRNGRHTPLMIIVRGGTLSEESYNKLQEYMNDIKGENGQHAFMVLEAESNETTVDFEGNSQPNVEVKDIANILQKDELFQDYQENARKKVQSAFLLPDLYVGYTTDFNRATSQTAMEVTEKQVFQPERKRLAWMLNNKLLNGYGFKYVEAEFAEPDITNPDDIQKLLNITERAGGLTMNEAKALTAEVLGKEAEDYPGTFDMNDIGNIPLAYLTKIGNSNNEMSGVDGRLQSAMTALRDLNGNMSGQNRPDGDIEEGAEDVDMDLDASKKRTTDQLDGQIAKAARNGDDEVVAIMKEVRRMLSEMGGDADEEAD